MDITFFKKNALACLLWLGVLIYLSVYTLMTSHTPASMDYYNASHLWLQGENIYKNGAWAFIYFPQSALFFLPFALLPFKIGQLCWVIISTVTLALSLFSLTLLLPFNQKKTYLFLTIVCYVVAQGSLKLGQMNITIASLFFFFIYAFSHKKWWLSAFLLAFALAVKPTSMIFVLLFFALYQELRIKLLVFLAGFLALPFLFQHVDYVFAQYKNYGTLSHSMAAEHAGYIWAQLWGVIYFIAKVGVPTSITYPFSAFIGLVILLLGYYSKKYFSFKHSIFYVYTLGAIYLMLFNPRTESNDYIILMPMLCFFFSSAWFLNDKKAKVFMGILIFFMMFNSSISHLLGMVTTFFRPFCTLLFFGYFTYSVYKKAPWLDITRKHYQPSGEPQ
jgi:alpha-1,2-mannosyltransferase